MSSIGKKPKFQSKPPEDFKVPWFTFDEFDMRSSEFEFWKLRNDEGQLPPESVKPSEAASSMREKPNERSEICLYYTSMSSCDDFYDCFNLPEEVHQVDLYSNFWPQDEYKSNYLRERSKLFYGFHEGYTSPIYSPYAGMSEWIYVSFGELKLTVLIPKVSRIECTGVFEEFIGSEDFSDFEEPINSEKGDFFHYHLKAGSFLIIPPGSFSIRYAVTDCFCFAGEFLKFTSLKIHLDCFKDDVETYQSCISAISKIPEYPTSKEINLEQLERDRYIRFAFLFMKTKLSGEAGKALRKAIGQSELVLLNSHLKEWKKAHLTCSAYIHVPDSSTYVDEDFIERDQDIPSPKVRRRRKSAAVKEDGLQVKGRKRKRSSRLKALKDVEDPVDVLMDQTSTHNQTY